MTSTRAMALFPSLSNPLKSNGALRMDHFSPDYWNMHDKKISDPNAWTPTRKTKSIAQNTLSQKTDPILRIEGDRDFVAHIEQKQYISHGTYDVLQTLQMEWLNQVLEEDVQLSELWDEMNEKFARQISSLEEEMEELDSHLRNRTWAAENMQPGSYFDEDEDLDQIVDMSEDRQEMLEEACVGLDELRSDIYAVNWETGSDLFYHWRVHENIARKLKQFWASLEDFTSDWRQEDEDFSDPQDTLSNALTDLLEVDWNDDPEAMKEIKSARSFNKTQEIIRTLIIPKPVSMYVFTEEQQEKEIVIYVGISIDIYNRHKDHKCHDKIKEDGISDRCFVYLCSTNSDYQDVKTLEANLIHKTQPKYNTMSKKTLGKHPDWSWQRIKIEDDTLRAAFQATLNNYQVNHELAGRPEQRWTRRRNTGQEGAITVTGSNFYSNVAEIRGAMLLMGGALVTPLIQRKRDTPPNQTR
ncbi:hypothetical protein PROFUN_13881 [Planoprotostelium fungivorum]|uniref:GIY-YIG domain-containing protein n=1 Tax=Planoprotostelium fungivorum TaxID=1890364 RepID=A0A2P6N2B7_9EUKA|nr:hypothetical protein PROFUN_13881 [Planoprotostelium fungivorum]